MHTKITAALACTSLLLLACPRPSDHDTEDSAAGETGSAPAPAPAGSETAADPKPAPNPAPGPDACVAELDALRDAVEQVEQCIAEL